MSAITPDGKDVECGEMAEYCRCVKPAGHVAAGDEVHGCDPTECLAQWTGVYGTPGWVGVSLPWPVSS